MKKILSLLFTIFILTAPVFAARHSCDIYTQGRFSKKCIISTKPRNKKNVPGNVGVNYNMYGQWVGTYRIKGKRIVSYDKDGHRVGYCRRLANGKVVKYNRSGKRIASY